MQDINPITDFDFDEWAKLAKDDPDAFEEKRKKMIQEVINNVSPEIRKRVQGLQWQIDQVRSSSPNPMASCLKISQMMWDRVLDEGGLLDHMDQLNQPDINKLQKPRESATVINLEDRKQDKKR